MERVSEVYNTICKIDSGNLLYDSGALGQSKRGDGEVGREVGGRFRREGTWV